VIKILQSSVITQGVRWANYIILQMLISYSVSLVYYN